jgi:hypothetical protein
MRLALLCSPGPGHTSRVHFVFRSFFTGIRPEEVAANDPVLGTLRKEYPEFVGPSRAILGSFGTGTLRLLRTIPVRSEGAALQCADTAGTDRARYCTTKQSRSLAKAIGPEKRFLISEPV